MSRLWAKIIGLGLLAGLLLPGIAAAAGDEESFLVLVADSRKLTGWEAWWANLYNDSHFYFALVTVIIIPVVGLCFGLLADIFMSRIGIDLKSRELAEH
ncbi:MAG: DVU0150 family protein [Desulfobaccales bacterium]